MERDREMWGSTDLNLALVGTGAGVADSRSHRPCRRVSLGPGDLLIDDGGWYREGGRGLVMESGKGGERRSP